MADDLPNLLPEDAQRKRRQALAGIYVGGVLILINLCLLAYGIGLISQ